MPPEEYRILVGWADGGYWTAIDEAIPEQPEVREITVPTEDYEDTVDLPAISVVRRAWRARMDPTLCILLDEAAKRHHWTAAKFCAAYAALAGPTGAAAVFLETP